MLFKIETHKKLQTALGWSIVVTGAAYVALTVAIRICGLQ